MHKSKNLSSYRISLTLSIAILFHAVLGILLFQLLPNIEPKKTIPIRLIIPSEATSATTKTKANAPSSRPEEDAVDILNKEQLQNASKEFISTTSSSENSVITSQDNAFDKDTKTTPNQSLKTIKQDNIFIPKITTNLPDVRRDLAKSSKNKAASKSFSDMASLFLQQKTMEASVVQLSTDPTIQELSAYEQKIFKKLTNTKYHDQLYPIISKLNESKILTLEIVLFPNGSLKNAHIRQSSNLPKLDNAVRRIALDASPYLKPPTEDSSIGFRYRVSIRYDPISK